MTVTSFAELSLTVAANWNSADNETKNYCQEVARILKERHTELTKVGGLCCLSTIDSVSPGLKEEAKPRNAENELKYSELTEFGAIFCLPTMDSESPTHAFKGQSSQQYLSMHAPVCIFEQDTMNSPDTIKTWLHNQAATIPNATTTTTRGNDSLDGTNRKMRQPRPSGVIQETPGTASMPIMTGSALSHTGTDHEDVQQEFRVIMNARRRATISNVMTLSGMAKRALSQTGTDHEDVQSKFRAIFTASRREHISNTMTIPGMAVNALSRTGKDHEDFQSELRVIMNASRRADISNMMTLPGTAPMREGIRCFGEQPIPNNIRYSAPDCKSFKRRQTELTTPMPEGIRRYSEPECQNSPLQDRSKEVYDIQELDVSASNILDMWWSVREPDTF